MGFPFSTYVQRVTLEGTKNTYAGASEILAANLAANATDIATVSGAAGIIVRVRRIEISADATGVGSVVFRLIKRTEANTGGTFASNPATAYDSQDPPHSAVRRIYTANPSALGAGGNIRIVGYALPAATATGYPFAPEVWEFSAQDSKSVILRGPEESIAFNWGGQAINAGLRLWLNIVWTEEDLSGN